MGNDDTVTSTRSDSVELHRTMFIRQARKSHISMPCVACSLRSHISAFWRFGQGTLIHAEPIRLVSLIAMSCLADKKKAHIDDGESILLGSLRPLAANSRKAMVSKRKLLCHWREVDASRARCAEARVRPALF
jgi:hypothetical protein